ncbi:hypothetical protein [Dyadobacter frigoris]|uniref:DUF3185 family protein n=1 Tax=Dyadobacter frigoris TaxID=2576211 RepID=A0A4V6Y1T7_9BACT|nr:hypothetical protein [Dyadobacter frigoris]TKT86503.1 hypothetical protein FDK13_31975 [Dyadobacter frigoris]
MRTIILGVLLLLIGIMLFIFNHYDFVTFGKIIHVGNLKIARENDHLLEWSPWLGIAVSLVGVFTMAIGILNRK